MGNLTDKVQSKDILKDSSLFHWETELLNFSGLSKDQIVQINIEIASFDNKTVNIRTLILGD